MMHSEIVDGTRITIYGSTKTEIERKKRELGILGATPKKATPKEIEKEETKEIE